MCIEARELNRRRLDQVILWTAPAGADGWELADGDSRSDPRRSSQHGPLWRIAEVNGLNPLLAPLRLRLVAQTADGLWTSEPTLLHVKTIPDLPPTAELAILHDVVLPTATPIVEYRIADDRRLSQARLVVEIEPREPSGESATGDPLGEPGASPTTRRVAQDLPVGSGRVHRGTTPLSLTPLNVSPGDWLRVTVEVADQRQGRTTRWSRSPSAALRIGDLQEVLAAISSADQATEDKLDALIDGHLGGRFGGDAP